MELTQAYGLAHFIIIFELGAAALLSLYAALSVMLRLAAVPRTIFDGIVERETVSRFFFSLFLFVLFYSQWLSGGREIAAVGIAMPGSLVTRALEVETSLWLRRLLEPSLWFLVLCIAIASYDARSKKSGRCYFISFIFIVVLLCGEALLLTSAGEVVREVGPIRLLHLAVSQLVLLPLIVALCFDRGPRKHRRSIGSVSLFSCGVLISLIVPSLLTANALEARSPQSEPLKAGAHYYSWFPSNWKGGVVGDHTVPKIQPKLGSYNSADDAVFSQHVAWAREAGLDFFVFDWWPKRPWIGKRVYSHAVREKLLSGMEFSILYESLDLKEDGDKTYPGEESNVVFMTEARSLRLRKHWEYLAKHYFHRENYLRINGKPVLFVYASRHLVGPVAKAIREARRHVKETTGQSLYVVGDEVFFNVLRYSNEHGLLLLPEGVPNWDRLSAFDAVTSYNPYDSARVEHGGSEGAERFLADVRELYAHYKRVAITVGIKFIPGVLPGYNDRGVRPKENHFVIPRELKDETLFFSKSLEEWATPFFDSRTPMFTVTTWNEWNEGTQIEPALVSSKTRKDSSETGDFYTQGEVYWGYDSEFLSALQKYLEKHQKRPIPKKSLRGD